MSNHLAEFILAAVKNTVTGLTTTGSRVVRGRVYATDQVPALSIFMGPDEPPAPGDEGDTYPYIDSDLNIVIRVHVQASDGVLDTELNKVRGEVAKAMLADRTLGRDDVINTWEGTADEPEISGEGNKRTATQDINYFVKYRRLFDDPTVES